MRIPNIPLYDLMTSGGAAILLIAWLVQQTYLQAASDRLASLNAAKTTATVLESNHLILRAIAGINGVDKKEITTLLDAAEHNQYALFDNLQTTRVIRHEEGGVNPSSPIGKKLAEFGIRGSASIIITETRVEEAQIRRSASRAWWAFLAIYLVGGLITLSGSVLKALKGEVQKS